MIFPCLSDALRSLNLIRGGSLTTPPYLPQQLCARVTAGAS
jgi:hypothetical protein